MKKFFILFVSLFLFVSCETMEDVLQVDPEEIGLFDCPEGIKNRLYAAENSGLISNYRPGKIISEARMTTKKNIVNGARKKAAIKSNELGYEFTVIWKNEYEYFEDYDGENYKNTILFIPVTREEAIEMKNNFEVFKNSLYLKQ